ncbi:MAG: hypothetical protein DYG90_00480 [Chloroflexi bacterium CFX6]|nr:hypothetical protein [Chloroflexi bacterium CFX6]
MTAGLSLTERQARIYDFIRDHLTKHGHAPTVREIGRGVGISSTSVVLYHLGKLVKAGRIVRDFNTARAIELPDVITLFIGDEIVVEVDGQLVRGRVVEPVAKAA